MNDIKYFHKITHPANLRELAFILALLVFLIIFFSPYLFTSPFPLIMPTSPLGSDLLREVWPVARTVEIGLEEFSSLHFWRSYHLSGTPLLGHPIAPIVYPLFWLTQILTISFGLNVLVVIHLWIIGLSTYLLLRLEFRTRPEAALVGAFLFSMTPRWIALVSGGHWNSIYSIAWWSCSILCFFRFWAVTLLSVG